MTWTFGGTNISTTANGGLYGVKGIDSANNLTPTRGDNIKVPLREGRIHSVKVYDQRIISLGFWVVGSSQANYETRIDNIKELLGERNQQTLSRTMADASVREAEAEVINQLEMEKVAPYTSYFIVDFLLAGAFMRSDTVTTSGNVTAAASPTNFNFTNAGTVDDKTAVITFHGALENPKLENLNNSVWVGLQTTLTTNEISVDTEAFTSTPSAEIGNVQHSGDTYFMVLEPGVNSMRITSDTLGGWVQVDIYAPFL